MTSKGPFHTATSILFLNWNIQVQCICGFFCFPRSVLTSTSIKNSELLLQGNSGKTEGRQIYSAAVKEERELIRMDFGRPPAWSLGFPFLHSFLSRWADFSMEKGW